MRRGDSYGACMRRLLAPLLALVVVALPAAAQDFDIVIANGRVMDPESGLDAVRHVGIRAGKVAAVSAQPLRGRDLVDAEGLVVAPGFIDLHAQAQHVFRK